jgi:hypothetical protein
MPSPSRFANITRRLEDLLSDGGQAVDRERQKSTLVSRSKPSARRSEMGHEERFPPRSLSGRCGVTSMNLRRLCSASIRSSISCAKEESEKFVTAHFRQFAFDRRVDLRGDDLAYQR